MARKRTARGRGSVYERSDGLWVGAVSAGYEDGHRQRFVVYGKTAEIADKKLGKLKAAIARGEMPTPASKRGTLAELLTAWLDTVIKPRRKATTYVDHKNTIEKHIVPAIGSVAVSKLTAGHIEKMHRALAAAKVGDRTRQKVHVVLRAALRRAVRQGKLGRSPAEIVDAPTYVAARRQPFDREEARTFVQAIKGDPLEPLYLLAIFTGMRQGEILALRAQDLDLAHSALHVQNSLQTVSKKRALVNSKTDGSRRRIELPAIVVASLRALLKRQMGGSGSPKGYLFCDDAGEPLQRTTLLKKRFLPLLAAAKIRQIRFHDLRHTAATLLLGQGAHPKIVAELLGHSRISTTIDTYSHMIPTLQRGAVNKLASSLRPPKPKENGGEK